MDGNWIEYDWEKRVFSVLLLKEWRLNISSALCNESLQIFKATIKRCLMSKIEDDSGPDPTSRWYFYHYTLKLSDCSRLSFPPNKLYWTHKHFKKWVRETWRRYFIWKKSLATFYFIFSLYTLCVLLTTDVDMWRELEHTQICQTKKEWKKIFRLLLWCVWWALDDTSGILNESR